MFPFDSAELFVYEGSARQKVLDPTGALIATDGDKQRLTFTLTGEAEAFFNIDRVSFNNNASKGELTTKVPLDYDADPPPLREFSGTVTASDGTGREASLDVTITLWDVTETGNAAPQFVVSADDNTPLPEKDFTMAENAVAKYIGTVYAMDTDTDDEVTYSLERARCLRFHRWEQNRGIGARETA